MDETKNILIADNEPNIRTVLSALLEREGFEVTAVANGEEAKQILNHKDFDLVITDLKMPEMDGMALLHWLREFDPEIPIIMITAYATVDTAVEALKLGAFDYITKPFDLDEMKTVIEKASRTHELAQMEFQPPQEDPAGIEMIGENPRMKEIYRLIKKVANSPSPVLITGESGTGKGLVALALHQRSSRKEKPFIQINCAAIPRGLIESELFGYEKGAFTGAVTSKPGRFELADEGTLFLDEIGEIEPDFQVKLLRAVQHNTFERVGGIDSIQVETRLITATNRNLKQEMKQGKFREDLFYRLNVIPIQLPALRERIDDIPLLARHFTKMISKKIGKKTQEIPTETMAILTRYPWPGNIRELENVLERAIVLSDGPQLTPSDLPKEIQGKSPGPKVPFTSSDLKTAIRQQGAALERELISNALKETHGNVTRAAKKLGISRKSLQLKMRQYGLRTEKD